jgi:hypothetical protein
MTYPAAARLRSRKARNQARHRERERRGIKVFRVPIPEHDFADALIEAGLPEDEALKPDVIEQQLHELVEKFITRWLPDRCR